MKETQVYHKIFMAIAAFDARATYLRIENACSAGLPDILIVTGGLHLWLEVKVGEPLIRPYQYVVGRRLARSGAHVRVVSYDPGIDLFSVWKYPISAELRGKFWIPTLPPYLWFTTQYIHELFAVP